MIGFEAADEADGTVVTEALSPEELEAEAGRKAFIEQLKARDRANAEREIQNNKRLMVGLSDRERLKRSMQTEDEAPNVALAPLRWNIDKERRFRKAKLDEATDAFEAGCAYRACAHFHAYAALEKKIERRRRKAKLAARETAPKRFKLMRESVAHLRQCQRFDESKAKEEAVQREEDAYWHTVSGKDFEDQAAKRLDHLKTAFDNEELAHERAFSVVRKQLLSELDTNTKAVLRANPKTVEDELWKAAHFAKTGNAERLEELLARRGAKVTMERDRDTSWTPLFFASREGNYECVKVLCAYGADTRAVDPKGQTPLHLAANFASKEICGCLLEHGAPIEHEDFYGLTAIDLATERGRPPELVAFLEQFMNEMERIAHKKRLAERRKDPGILQVISAARGAAKEGSKNVYKEKSLADIDPELLVSSAEGYERTAENDRELLVALRKLDFKEKAFGKDYVGLLPTLQSVAAAYKSRKDSLGMRSSLERIAQIAAKNYGLRHMSTAAAYNNLGEAFHALGEDDDAAAAFAYALRISHEARRGRMFKGGEPREEYHAVMIPLRNLALHLFHKGDVNAALPMFKHLVELHEKLHDPALAPEDGPPSTAAAEFLGIVPKPIESPALVQPLLTYGYALMLDTDYALCRAQFDRALAIVVTHEGDGAEATIVPREMLGLLSYYEEKFGEAEAHFKKVHDILLAHGRARDDPDVRRQLENIATACCRRGPRTWE